MDPSDSGDRFGALLQQFRVRAGLTQDELARRSGVSARAIRDIERGRVRQPQPESLRRLADALHLTAADRVRIQTVHPAHSGVDTVRVNLLGPLVVTRGAGRVPLPVAAQRGLLALLTLRVGQPVGRDEIVDVLWGPSPPKTFATQIHMAVAHLRTVLDPDRPLRQPGGPIERVRDAYLLRLDAEQCDQVRFEALIARAQARSAEQLDLLDEALSGWRGAVLVDAGTRLRDHPDAQALNQQRIAVALRFADLVNATAGETAAAQRYPTVVRHLRSIAGDEPYHEALHARLLLAQAGSGDRATALRTFAEFRRRLVDELGVEPAREMQDAYLRVLRDETAGTPRATVTIAQQDGSGTPSLLPPDIADFSGRAAESNRIEATVSRSGQRRTALPVAAISGMGGIGKTALALHVAHRLAGAFPDGQLYVNLRGAEPDPVASGDALSRFLRFLGVDSRAIPDDVGERAALYRNRLAGLRMLVVLDNAASAEQVRPLLPGAPPCAVLLTSRTRLTGVEGAQWVDLDVFEPEDALRLLANLAGRQRVADEPDEAAELVRLCGQLPLAVRVAGARLAARPSWRLAHLTGMLRDERRRLDHLSLGDLEVRASLAFSYEGLDPMTCRLFRLLGLFDLARFPAWFAACLLESDTDGVLPHLDALVDAQLLSIAGVDQRGHDQYRFHDLVRLFARQRAEAEDSDADRERALDRGLGGWLAVAADAASRVPGPCYATINGAAFRPVVDLEAIYPPGDGGDAALAWFDAERAALLSAVRQACDLDRHELAFDLAGSLEKYFDLRGMYTEWGATNERVMEVCQRHGNLLGEAVMLRGLIDVMAWNTSHNDDDQAMALLYDAGLRLRTLFQKAGDQRGIADAAVIASWGLTARGAYAEAVDTGNDALRLADATGHVGGQARANVALALAWREQRRVDLALGHLRSALIQARKLGNPRYEATVLQFIGVAHLEAGELDASRHAVDDSLAISRRYRDHYAEALTMLVLAQLHHARAEPGGREAAEASLALGREYNLPHHIADALGVLGDIALREGHTAEATAHLAESVQLWRTRGWPSYLAGALERLGTATRETDPTASRQAWTEARDLYTSLGNTDRAAELDTLIAR
ncbi:BTAD domain-containing putative transcriptional regulator [Dactylosporangium siamense]|uniref:BTAD domain-containing putative transcriptional regulator n=1 Tax=Dactylosporangium siamense TaxID=685454 RepID=UPI001941CB0B|nr:BTAD domain-containing putative transcriptional regulator [Dactylosporangium siamense]